MGQDSQGQQKAKSVFTKCTQVASKILRTDNHFSAGKSQILGNCNYDSIEALAPALE